MIANVFAAAVEQGYGLLEWFYIMLLGLMVIAVGLFSLVVVVRMVEPRGIRPFLRRVAGKE